VADGFKKGLGKVAHEKARGGTRDQGATPWIEGGEQRDKRQNGSIISSEEL